MNTRKTTKKQSNKRKRKKSDSAYSQRANKRPRTDDNTNHDVLALRTDNRTEVPNEKGELTPLKTSVFVSWDKIESSAENIDQLFSTNTKKVKSHRPIHSVEVSSPSGRPRIVLSPGQSRMRNTMDIGPIRFFSNIRKPEKETTGLDNDAINAAFYDSDAYHQFVAINEKIKRKVQRITKQLLHESHLEKIKNEGKRTTSQNKQMVNEGVSEKHGGAARYTNKVFVKEDIKNIRWEWLHLIAYSILGSKSQHHKNLTAGTPEANTAMMLVESQIKKLADYYPEGFTLRVNAELIADTHVSKKIAYSIITPDFTIPFDFDGQSLVKPHRVFGEYIDILVDSIILACEASSYNKLKK